MDRAAFWRTIDDAVAASSGDLNHEDEYIRDALLKSGTDACVGFDAVFAEVMSEAYTWDLWGAAHVINGGCSDDGFVYFRCWLIAQGEAVFTQAMRDPESLADVVDPDQPAEEHEYEALLSLGRSCYEKLSDDKVSANYAALGAAGNPDPAGPRGNPWDEEDLASQLPRLTSLYG